ncbi:MAG: hypothetical protein FJX80_03450 [Bacteroidetes bacterium]|nr:hypothetical protein [Bacteroidota bacterium]
MKKIITFIVFLSFSIIENPYLAQKLITTHNADTKGFIMDSLTFKEGSFIFTCPLTDYSEKQYTHKINELQTALIGSGLNTKDKIHFIINSCKSEEFTDCIINKFDLDKESKKPNYLLYFEVYYFSKDPYFLTRCQKLKGTFKVTKSSFSEIFHKIEFYQCPKDAPSQIPMFKDVILETLQPNFSDSEKIIILEKQNIQLSNDLQNLKSLFESANETIKNQEKRLNRQEVLLDTLHSPKIKLLEQENYQAPSKGEYVLPKKKKKESLLNKFKFAKKEKNGSKD